MTQVTGKVIAGLIGFMAFGPAGLLFGLVLGHAFDRGLWRALQLSGPEAVHIMRAQFFETTFTLLGFVAKADGRVSEAEIAQTEALFLQLRLNAAQRRLEAHDEGRLVEAARRVALLPQYRHRVVDVDRI